VRQRKLARNRGGDAALVFLAVWWDEMLIAALAGLAAFAAWRAAKRS